MLVENDIIAPEGIMIDLANSIAFITSCNVRITITARQRDQPVRKKLMADTTVSLPPNSKSLVPVMHGALLCKRNFFFHPVQKLHLTLFAHLIGHGTGKVLISNDYPNAVLIPRKYRLGTVTEVMYENCFQAVFDLEAAKIAPKLASDQFNYCAVAISSVNPSLKTKLPNGIMIYSNKQAVRRISALVANFSIVWDFSAFVDISPKRWMTVPLKDDW